MSDCPLPPRIFFVSASYVNAYVYIETPLHPRRHPPHAQKADLENKKLREAARLEAAKRAKHEAEMKAREQKALRQAEVERRREQERAEREAREAKEREDKEAKRKAWLETKVSKSR